MLKPAGGYLLPLTLDTGRNNNRRPEGPSDEIVFTVNTVAQISGKSILTLGILFFEIAAG
jgi:hypothetical protein